MRRMFSENQIKSLVNKGIEDGEISGGTKLYAHLIFDDSGTNGITIISNKKEKFTKEKLKEGILYDASLGVLFMSVYRDDDSVEYASYKIILSEEDELSFFPFGSNVELTLNAEFHSLNEYEVIPL